MRNKGADRALFLCAIFFREKDFTPRLSNENKVKENEKERDVYGGH